VSSVTPTKFHGYSISPLVNTPGTQMMPCGATASQLHIGRLPERKGLCLYAAVTNRFTAQITPLAYFRNEKAARDCQVLLDWMILKQEPQP